MMSLLIGDIASDRISTGKANAICNAGGKMLKAIELEQKYGRPVTNATGDKILQLAPKVSTDSGNGCTS